MGQPLITRLTLLGRPSVADMAPTSGRAARQALSTPMTRGHAALPK
jgi:hypothetical protein